MKRARRTPPPPDAAVAKKLLRSAQQVHDWVKGKPSKRRVTYVAVPQVDLRKLRASMRLSQTQFAARFGFSLDSTQNREQGHR